MTKGKTKKKGKKQGLKKTPQGCLGQVAMDAGVEQVIVFFWCLLMRKRHVRMRATVINVKRWRWDSRKVRLSQGHNSGGKLSGIELSEEDEDEGLDEVVRRSRMTRGKRWASE